VSRSIWCSSGSSRIEGVVDGVDDEKRRRQEEEVPLLGMADLNEVAAAAAAAERTMCNVNEAISNQICGHLDPFVSKHRLLCGVCFGFLTLMRVVLCSKNSTV